MSPSLKYCATYLSVLCVLLAGLEAVVLFAGMLLNVLVPTVRVYEDIVPPSIVDFLKVNVGRLLLVRDSFAGDTRLGAVGAVLVVGTGVGVGVGVGVALVVTDAVDVYVELPEPL